MIELMANAILLTACTAVLIYLLLKISDDDKK